jgi:protein-tyrosine phosphatase
MQRETATWGLDLRRGWEVYPTEVVPEDVEWYALEGTRGVLIEFPGFWVGIDDSIGLVSEAGKIVEDAGLVPVLAHPERCRAVADDPACVRSMVERGWLICVNAPSFVGRHGATAERTAWTLLDAGYVALAASDGHTPGRPPVLNDAYDAVCKYRGEGVALPLFTGSALPWS